MASRQKGMMVNKRGVQRRCPSVTSWRMGKGFSNFAISPRNLALFFAIMVGGSTGFAQVANVTRAAASIEGTVTAAAAQGEADAIPGVLVKLTGPLSAPDPQSSTTDGEGHY